MRVYLMFFSIMLMKQKMNPFYKYELKIKNNFFSNNKLNLQPGT